MAMQAPARPEDRMTPSNAPTHAGVLDFFKRTSSRLQNRSQRILECRQMRRGLLRVPIPKNWATDNTAVRDWASVCLPEHKLLDLNLENVLGERKPELSRIPLGTTDQAIEDGDQLEVWSQSAYDRSVDEDAVVGKLVEDGELAGIVMPTRAGPDEIPEYTRTREAKGGLAVIEPDPKYDRDEKGKAPGTREYGGKRSEKKSREAYDEARQRWLAEHPLWYVRVVDALDCAPMFVRGKGDETWIPEALIVRTLYDREELLEQGFNWESMGRDVLIPLDFDAGRTYGNGGQVYLYEIFAMVRNPKKGGRKTPFIFYSVGGEDTWETGADGNRKASVIDCEAEYGLTERFWGYFWGLHTQDSPDWRGVPFIQPLLQTLKNNAMMRSTLLAASYNNSFTGHYEEVNPNLPSETILEGFKTGKTTPIPKTGEVVKAMGKVTPAQQATTGADAYRMLEMDREDLAMNTPDSATTGGGDAAARSGHALVVGEKLLLSGKRQIGLGVLKFAEFVTEHILRISCAAIKGDPKNGRPSIDVPVFVTEEEQLDDGTVNEKTSVLTLEERWVGGQYKLRAEFPQEGNLAEVEQMVSLAERGFATDEDVDKARGIKNSVWARVQRDIYQWRKSPMGQMELNMRAAEYQGNEARKKLLRMVAAQQATPGGGPVSAIDPSVPGTAVLSGMMGGMGGMGGGAQPASGGGTTTAQAQRAGTIGGQMGMASEQQDARALAEMGA